MRARSVVQWTKRWLRAADVVAALQRATPAEFERWRVERAGLWSVDVARIANLKRRGNLTLATYLDVFGIWYPGSDAFCEVEAS